MMSYLQFELPSDVLTKDAVMMAGYRGSDLGRPFYNFSLESNAAITNEAIESFRSQAFVGDNCVFAGVGMSHAELCTYATELFGTIPRHSEATAQTAKYVGGLYVEQRELKEPFLRVALGFEIGGWKSPEIITMCVLQMLYGGGSSFSAGGPGKGMFSKLYTNILNQYHAIESCNAFVNIFNNGGIFGIEMSAQPEYAESMIALAYREIIDVAMNGADNESLSRAKNMLKSALMTQLESRIILCEDLARQTAVFGRRESPVTLCSNIDNITSDDLRRAANKLLLSQPTVICFGQDTTQMPMQDRLEDIRRHMLQLMKRAIDEGISRSSNGE